MRAVIASSEVVSVSKATSGAARIVASRAAEIAYVDLRYATGFAIGWRSGGKEVASG